MRVVEEFPSSVRIIRIEVRKNFHGFYVYPFYKTALSFVKRKNK